MVTLLRSVSRVLVHAYCLAALLLGLMFFREQALAHRAEVALMAGQLQALIIIAQGLHGTDL